MDIIFPDPLSAAKWHRILPNRQQPKFGASEARHLPSLGFPFVHVIVAVCLFHHCWRISVMIDGHGSWHQRLMSESFLQQVQCAVVHQSGIQGPRTGGRLDHGKVGSSQGIRDLISDQSQHLRCKGDRRSKFPDCCCNDDGGQVHEKPQTDMKGGKSKNKNMSHLQAWCPRTICSTSTFPVHSTRPRAQWGGGERCWPRVYAIRASV